MIAAYTLIYTSLLIISGCLQLAGANMSLLEGPAGGERASFVFSTMPVRWPGLQTGIRCPPGSVPVLPRAELTGGSDAEAEI